MFQPLCVALRPLLDIIRAALPVQKYLLSELLKVNFVTPPAPVKTEKEDDRAMRHGGN